MPYAKAKDGCMLYYKDWGQGDPVVLLHGWPLSRQSPAGAWSPIAGAAHARLRSGSRFALLPSS